MKKLIVREIQEISSRNVH